jgi:short subunit dehydrogenase-like uncharacterized protein
MTYSVLLYGATGHSGKLIAAEGALQGMSKAAPPPGRRPSEHRMILAARDATELRRLADTHQMDFRVFGLDDRDEVVRAISDVDVVINAAGPFAYTAEPLAKAAIIAKRHYVDINGELDVYLKLDDLGVKAQQRRIALISAAGHTAAVSDLLLAKALGELQKRELGAIRIAVSQPGGFSHGSAVTAARSLREQVLVIRQRADAANGARPMSRWHEPVGRLERRFDFGPLPSDRAGQGTRPRIASAANLVDTVTAQLEVERRRFSVKTIESYVQMDGPLRAAYLFGATLASVNALPAVRSYVNAQIGYVLPDGEPPESLQKGWHAVVLEIEDVYRMTLIDWCFRTPHFYQFTAQVVVEVARRLAGSALIGWTTPAQALDKVDLERRGRDDRDFLRGCVLQRRAG